MQAYLYLFYYYYLCKYKNQNASVAGSICTFLGSLPPDALSTLEMNKQALRKSSTPLVVAHTLHSVQSIQLFTSTRILTWRVFKSNATSSTGSATLYSSNEY